MTPLQILTILTEAGCRLTPEGTVLRIQDPQHALTDALRQAIQQHKSALLAMLCPRPPRHAGGLPITDAAHPCPQCGSIEWQHHATYRYCLSCGWEDGLGTTPGAAEMPR